MYLTIAVVSYLAIRAEQVGQDLTAAGEWYTAKALPKVQALKNLLRSAAQVAYSRCKSRYGAPDPVKLKGPPRMSFKKPAEQTEAKQD